MSCLTPSSSPLDGAIAHLQDHLGLHIPPDRRPEIEKKIRRTMAAQGVRDADWWLRLLPTDEAMLGALVDEITVGETYFFRDPGSFELLRKMILPELKRIRPPFAPLNVWSAGCSTGEEAYSLAILLEEEGLAERAHILATDIAQAALQKAREAVYGPWSLRGDSDGQLAARYFSWQDGKLRLAERFRSRVRFRYLNLASDFKPSSANGLARMDLILCRNVLIYLDEKTTKIVARRLFDCLADGGWLLTGPSDPPLWPHAPFKTIVTAAGVLYRRDDRAGRPLTGEKKPLATGQRPAAVAQAMRRPDRKWQPPARPAVALKHAGTGTRPERKQDDPGVDLAAIRALADQGEVAAAWQAANEAIARHPLSVEPRYLLATLALASNRVSKTTALLRQVIYIDPTLAAAHMLLGTALVQTGNLPAARRAYENAFALAAERPEHEVLPLTDGETAGGLARAAKQHIDRLLSEEKAAL